MSGMGLPQRCTMNAIVRLEHHRPLMKVAIALLGFHSAVLSCLAQDPRRWPEDSRVGVEILEPVLDESSVRFNLRFSNFGPDAIFIPQRAGTTFAASIRVEERIEGRWTVISRRENVKIQCSDALPVGYASTQPVSIGRQTRSGREPATIRASLVVYHALRDCKDAKNGLSVFSSPETLMPPQR